MAVPGFEIFAGIEIEKHLPVGAVPSDLRLAHKASLKPKSMPISCLFKLSSRSPRPWELGDGFQVETDNNVQTALFVSKPGFLVINR